MFLDISKAFDRVWHDDLIYKLKRCGVSGRFLALTVSFPGDGKQRTALNDQCSCWGDTSGRSAPGLSLIGPLIFLLYINDLTAELKCNVKLFADDTSQSMVVQESNLAANDMNHDMNLISKWTHAWRRSLNPDPQNQAAELIISTKRQETDHQMIFFNDKPLVKVEENEYLGAILDRKLTLSAHIKAAIYKKRKCIRLLKYLSSYLPRHNLEELYKLYVQPFLDYGGVIYHIQTEVCEFSQNIVLSSPMEKLESVQ